MEMTSFLSFSFHSLPLLPIQIKCKSAFGVFAKTIIQCPHQKKRKKEKKQTKPKPHPTLARSPGLTKKNVINSPFILQIRYAYLNHASRVVV